MDRTRNLGIGTGGADAASQGKRLLDGAWDALLEAGFERDAAGRCMWRGCGSPSCSTTSVIRRRWARLKSSSVRVARLSRSPVDPSAESRRSRHLRSCSRTCCGDHHLPVMEGGNTGVRSPLESLEAWEWPEA
jgi:hypothetical protein